MFNNLGPSSTRVVAAAALILASVTAQAVPVSNGDFSLGNAGFASQYIYDPSATFMDEGRYAVGTNPRNYHSLAASFGDHTTGSGQMLIANGALSSAKYVWQQTLSVVPNAQYVFSGWVASWGLSSGDDPSPAVLRFVVDGTQVGVDFAAPAPVGQWSQFQVAWNSGSQTSSVLQIFDVNTAYVGNDFALDDFDVTVAQVPEPATLALLGIGLAGLAGSSRRKRSYATGPKRWGA